MSLMKELYLKSKQLYDHLLLDYPLDETKQDDYVDHITSLLNDRQQLVDGVLEMTSMNESEERILEEVLKIDKAIEEKLLSIKRRIGKDLGDLRLKKQKGQQYENPYNRSTVDGVFFDKRGV